MTNRRKEFIKQRIANALCAQFENYTWEQMIEEALSHLAEPQEIAWAKKHLDYKLVEI